MQTFLSYTHTSPGSLFTHTFKYIRQGVITLRSLLLLLGQSYVLDVIFYRVHGFLNHKAFLSLFFKTSTRQGFIFLFVTTITIVYMRHMLYQSSFLALVVSGLQSEAWFILVMCGRPVAEWPIVFVTKEKGQPQQPGRWHILVLETIAFTRTSIKERTELHTNHAYIKAAATSHTSGVLHLLTITFRVALSYLDMITLNQFTFFVLFLKAKITPFFS